MIKSFEQFLLEKDSIDKKSALFDDYPDDAVKNAKKAIEWKKEHGDEVTAMTRVGWARAHQLANKEKLSVDVISRMAQFKRHYKNSKIDPKFKDTPWKDNGHVSYLGWGGEAGVNWAIKKMKYIRDTYNI